MDVIKKAVRGAGYLVHVITGTACSYLGVLCNIAGTVMGILASVLTVCIIAGICVYVKVLPMFTEAREVVFDKMANLSEEDFIMKEDTIVYDSKGKVVGSVNAGQYKYVPINDISSYIYDGYIAVEDRRFKTHGGVDVVATLRAGIALLKNNMKITQGGSTITQQVIKNNLLTQDKSYTRKIAEVLLAPAVEAKFTKTEIMEFYCNSNYYGYRCYGVGAASRYYFGKEASELEPQEAALLISLSNNPSAYDPVINPKDSLKKRNRVLKTMYDEGVINKKEYDSAVKSKIRVKQYTADGKNENYVVSYAIHCAANALMEKEDFKFQYLFKDKKDYQSYREKYSEVYGSKCEDIRSGGYKIYTSINMKKQKNLQKAIDEGLAYNTEKDSDTGKYALQGAAVCIDNDTNYVVAIVGGRGKKDEYNRAYLSARQSGSSIKPLIDYTPGFESGVYSPSTVVNDHKFENGPDNAGGSYYGDIRLREAVERSLNTVAWQVLETITPDYGLSYLEKLHFRNISYIDNDNMALSLGGFTEGVRVVDMAKGYCTLANNGSYSDRTCIKKIERVSDGTIYKNNNQKTQVFSKDAAWMMTDVLKGVLNEPYATGKSLKLDGKQICAGKTGTTNSSKDVWFCGYTKYYTTVVWAGYDTPRAMPGASGASIPGVIWKNYMNKIHTGLEPLDFDMPATIRMAEYDSNGDIIEGTAVTPEDRREPGMDYFSTVILEEKAEDAKLLKDKEYQQEVKKELKAFEKITIKDLAGYYEFEDRYIKTRDMVASVVDDDARKSFTKRLKNKYNSLKKEVTEWAKVVKAYEKQQAEENTRLAEEAEHQAEAARKDYKHKTAVNLARARIKRLHGHQYQPSDMEELIEAAKEALDACSGYSEYSSLKALYDQYKDEIKSLPSYEEYSHPVQTNTPVPVQPEEPEETKEPEETEF
ncbi:MAG: transglycosylase domain-containing protein [Lachnospiraceae bacterium]|nr:transglycosylase domain-containing protein [Lachnospiraceae bacterium]